MNVFKGLLYLIESDPPASPVLIESTRYGAATAAGVFADGLGNRAASQRRFGARPDAPVPNDDARREAASGCR